MTTSEEQQRSPPALGQGAEPLRARSGPSSGGWGPQDAPSHGGCPLTCGGGAERAAPQQRLQAGGAAVQAGGATGQRPQVALDVPQESDRVAAELGQLPQQGEGRQAAGVP